MGLGSFLFGSTGSGSTLTGGQKDNLRQLAGLNQRYNPMAYSTLGSLSANPLSSYQYDADNGARAFQQGIVNPAMDQMNQMIANTQHSSNLHSSANRAAQDKVRQDTSNYINNQAYQNMLNQQQMRQQAQEQAYGRQLQSLNSLLGGNNTVLGTQATYQKKNPGALDIISGIGGAAGSIASLF
jgi:hypothetical protein